MLKSAALTSALFIIISLSSLTASASKMAATFVWVGDNCVRLLDKKAKINANDLAAENERVRLEGTPDEYIALIQRRRQIFQTSNFTQFYQSYKSFQKKRLSQLIIRNANPRNISSLFLFKDNEDFIVGAMNAFLTGRPGQETYEDGETFLQDLIDEYEAYPDKIADKVYEGYTAMAQLKALQPFLDGPEALKFEDFLDSNGEITKTVKKTVPKWIRDQGLTEVEVKFTSHEGFMNYMNQLEKAVRHIFTTDKKEEVIRKSELYDRMYKQAKVRRKLEFYHQQLQLIERNNLQAHHLAYFEYLDLLLYGDEYKHLRPRPDAAAQLFTEELTEEYAYKYSWGGKRNSRKQQKRTDSKFNIDVDTAREMVNHGFSRFLKPALQFSVFAMTATVTATLGSFAWWNLAEKGPVGEIVASARAGTSETMREFFDATGSEMDCAAQHRKFNFEICTPQAALSLHADDIVALRAESPDEVRLEDNEELTGDIIDHGLDMVRLRDELRNNEAFVLANKLLREEVYFLYGAAKVGRVISEYSGQDEEVGRAFMDILHPNNIEEQETLITAFYTLTGIDVTQAVKLLLLNREEIESAVSNDSNPPTHIINEVRLIVEEQGFQVGDPSLQPEEKGFSDWWNDFIERQKEVFRKIKRYADSI